MGAVVKNYNKVAFEKCIFKNNIAKIGNGREYCGGVLSAESNSHSVFVDCKFSSDTDNFFADDFSSIVIYSNTYPVTTQLLDKPYFSKKATFSVVKSSVLNNTGIVNYECNDTTDFELLIRLINTMPKASGIVINLKIFYDRTVSGGKGLAKLNINLEQGKYIITAINFVTGESRANNITIIPRIIENNDLTKYYRNASQYSVKLLGDDGKAVGAGEEVTFNINGVFYTRTTNASGIAKLNINLQEGDYIITAEYKDCMVSNNIKVLPVLTTQELTKKYGTKDQFTASLVDGHGKAYAGQSVQFNINGLFYNRITDSNGQAKLNINLQPGEYIITSSYNEASIANKITVTA